MLVISRKASQRLMIGDDVIVTIVEIRGDKVRLGIEAPRSLPVHREEVWVQIQESNNQGDDHEHDDRAASEAESIANEPVPVAGVDQAGHVDLARRERIMVGSRATALCDE